MKQRVVCASHTLSSLEAGRALKARRPAARRGRTSGYGVITTLPITRRSAMSRSARGVSSSG